MKNILFLLFFLQIHLQVSSQEFITFDFSENSEFISKVVSKDGDVSILLTNLGDLALTSHLKLDNSLDIIEESYLADGDYNLLKIVDFLDYKDGYMAIIMEELEEESTLLTLRLDRAFNVIEIIDKKGIGELKAFECNFKYNATRNRLDALGIAFTKFTDIKEIVFVSLTPDGQIKEIEYATETRFGHPIEDFEWAEETEQYIMMDITDSYSYDPRTARFKKMDVRYTRYSCEFNQFVGDANFYHGSMFDYDGNIYCCSLDRVDCEDDIQVTGFGKLVVDNSLLSISGLAEILNEDQEKDMRATCIQYYKNDRFIALGVEENGPLGDGTSGKAILRVAEYDLDLNKYWESSLVIRNVFLFDLNIDIADDNTIYIYGACNPLGQRPQFKGFLAKFDNLKTATIDIEDTPTTLSISPNPSIEKIQIHGIEKNKQVFVNIIDEIGVQIKRIKYKSNQEIDVSFLPSGIYFLQVIDENGITVSLKMIKK